MSGSCSLLEQRRRAYSKRLSKLLDNRNGRVPGRSLDIADVGAMNARPIRELLLTPALPGTEPLEVRPEALANIHAKAKTPLSIINLQTISDISR